VKGAMQGLAAEPFGERCLSAEWPPRISAGLKGTIMRIALNIVGIVLTFFGVVWFLQGIGLLPGSFMTGQTKWAINGGLSALVGVVLLVIANRRRKPG
jgi:hypothetical protein